MASTNPTAQKMVKVNYWHIAITCLIAIEMALVMMGLVPAQLWTRLLPQSSASALDGPIPPVIAPIVTALLYFIPSIVGFLCSSWQRALLYATLPAWIGLGIFLIAATFKIGIFYLVSADHVTAQTSMLEMFAMLGGIGWLGRHLFKLR
jgi:hypothetical protein